MPKIVINADVFIKKCNEELIKHSDYEKGMEFVYVPPAKGTSGESSFSWNGPQNKTIVFAEVARKMSSLYDIKPTTNHRR